MSERFVGIDVGSTTVKAVVMDADGTEFLWKAYRRHDTKQAEHVHKMLTEIGRTFAGDKLHFLLTGSGARSLTPLVGGMFVQEVNAVQLAVETLHPDTGSVVELGGQDAKIIIWKPDVDGAGKRALTTMNDKCAGGTGATIDKIVTKVGMESSEVSRVHFNPEKIHPIAARCGVFAETDVVGLIKAGIDGHEIISSLCDAIVKQNLQVLTRGNVLRDRVMLLGGPHQFIDCLAECWRIRIPEAWAERKHVAADKPLDWLIHCPDDAQYFAAAGALLYGRRAMHSSSQEEDAAEETFEPVAKQTVKLRSSRKMGGKSEGGDKLVGIGVRRAPQHVQESINPLAKLHEYISAGRTEQLADNSDTLPPLVESPEELEAFAAQYRIPKFVPPAVEAGSTLGVYLGIDGGSTSTKAVLIGEDGEIVTTEYTLSNGNPLEDVKSIFTNLLAWAAKNEVEFDVLGAGATGYAAKILKETFDIDAAIVETVAHMMSSTKYYGDVDIICDIGGQDIKVIFMKNGRVSDFRLNTQCSAGNGYFLQSMAEQFGIELEDYESRAFEAKISPVFNYGCAVFMEQDKVNLQQLGWNAGEMLAGLAHVLPLNIWQYVVQEPNIAKHGRRIVLQGGPKNLAAVKAQVDYLREKVPDAEIHVHKFAGESGAIGAALEARRRHLEDGAVTQFVGIEESIKVTYTTKNDESTVCHFCEKNCRRTFIDTRTPRGNATRHISGNSCLKGTVEDEAAMKLITLGEKEKKKQTPNLFDFAARHVFRKQPTNPIAEAPDAVVEEVWSERKTWFGRNKGEVQRVERSFERSGEDAAAFRKGMTVAMPRVLMMYTGAPYFRAYFEALGCRVIWSEHTSEDLWQAGSRWGTIDQCFPAKVANAHVYDLLTRKKKPDAIFFPLITHVPGYFHNVMGNVLCTIQTGTPEVCEASFTKGRNFFAEAGIQYWKPTVNMEKEDDLADSMFDYLRERLKITRDESNHAHAEGLKSYKACYAQLRQRGRALVDQAIRNDDIIIMALGRPYHTDPGLSHEIATKFQVRGFPILGLDSIPWDDDFLMPLFEDDIRAGIIESPMELSDVWHRSFNYDTNLKIWGAKVAARHPNMVSIDFSSFKCGHDAPTYHVIDGISDASESAHFVFHDLDQNNPAASIGIRIDSVCYFLERMRNELRRRSREQSLTLPSDWRRPETAVSVSI